MNAPHERAKGVIERALAASQIPLKRAFVGRLGGTVTLTFHGEQSARDAAALLAPALSNIRILPGSDPGKATAMCNGRLEDVPVWRLHAKLGEMAQCPNIT